MSSKILDCDIFCHSQYKKQGQLGRLKQFRLIRVINYGNTSNIINTVKLCLQYNMSKCCC